MKKGPVPITILDDRCATSLKNIIKDSGRLQVSTSNASEPYRLERQLKTITYAANYFGELVIAVALYNEVSSQKAEPFSHVQDHPELIGLVHCDFKLVPAAEEVQDRVDAT